MTIVTHELRQNKTALGIWTAAIASLLVVCVFLFPEMKEEMGAVGNLFASMGSFTAAFGMDRLNYGTLVGFYAIECGNVLGLGGGLFAALMGTSTFSKEEKDRTAEFLLAQPVSRSRIAAEKATAIMLQIVAMNAIILGLSLASMAIIGESIPWKEVLLLHLGYFLLQVELAGICFGISPFLRRSGTGIGLGLAVMLYFCNLIANMTEQASFLKYLTPFAYCEGADIVANGSLDATLVLLGMAFGAGMVAAGFLQFRKKDIL